MAYTNEDAPFRGINLWRHWYLKHILPRENGQPIGPKLCLHNFMADGKPEFTGATEQNQIEALYEYLRRGMKPDVWWLDAGWYPCDYDWPRTGTWRPDPARFPNGLKPLGEACEQNGVQLLLWFEPERVRAGEELDREHHDWLLCQHDAQGNPVGERLFDLGNDEARNWLIAHVNSLIKESHVAIYRQDFNFNPAPIWAENEADDRIGMLENRHAQGYLAYWDAIILANPGLWIDSCASGGRRNDLETMRRAVPLHYTDFFIGDMARQQAVQSSLFTVHPYFKSGNSFEPDRPELFEYHMRSGLTPFTMVNTEPGLYKGEAGERARAYVEEWRAVNKSFYADYYMLTEWNVDDASPLAYEFIDSVTGEGFVQVYRRPLCDEPVITLPLKGLQPDKKYHLTGYGCPLDLTADGAALAKGLEILLEAAPSAATVKIEPAE
jgi:alpha-galactosidase